MARRDLLLSTGRSAKQQSPNNPSRDRRRFVHVRKINMALFPIAKLKAHSLTGRITQSLLHAAFKAVRRNRGAAGIDRVSLKMFEANLADNLLALERDLKSGSFQPLPLRRKFLDKGGGKFRPLIKEAVAAQVADGNILNLVEKFLRAGVME